MVRKVLVALGLMLALSAGTASADEGLEPVATVGELSTDAAAPATVEEAPATVEEAAATVEEAAATVEAEVTCAELSVDAEATVSADGLESSLDHENIAWD
jgi:hypothetical protein